MTMTKEKRDALVTVLYEKCANGEISREQRELLIQKANSMFVATEAPIVKESTENEPTVEAVVEESKELSPKEKYNLFKESVYEKYTTGKITIDQREELLEKAREKFLNITE